MKKRPFLFAIIERQKCNKRRKDDKDERPKWEVIWWKVGSKVEQCIKQRGQRRERWFFWQIVSNLNYSMKSIDQQETFKCNVINLFSWLLLLLFPSTDCCCLAYLLLVLLILMVLFKTVKINWPNIFRVNLLLFFIFPYLHLQPDFDVIAYCFFSFTFFFL